jgi:hypothetical protein
LVGYLLNGRQFWRASETKKATLLKIAHDLDIVTLGYVFGNSI